MFKGLKGKGFFLFVILILGSILLLSGCGGDSSQNSAPNTEQNSTDNAAAPKEDVKPINLTLAHFFPATHKLETEIIKGYIEAVDKATNGRVKITSYPAGTLLASTETYDGVVKGVADIGLSVYAYTRGRFPVVESFILPGLAYNNSRSASDALNEGIEILKPKELEDTHQMFSFAGGPGDLFTKKPVKSLADLKGMQIGATAGLRADAIGLLGANPVVIPMPEWYEALQKNVMEGGVSPVEALQGFRLAEVTGDYITLTPFLFNQAFFMVMNNDKWNSLPQDIQQAITEVNKTYYKEKIAPFFDEIDKAGMAFLKEKKKDFQIITLAPEESTLWQEKIKPLEAKYIGILDEKGLPGADIMKTVKELVEKANAKYPDRVINAN
ncbi:MAG: TRAP transporter substrate-binding protein [Thermincola sp.]|jgi:TRAP-type C4-dicarboxylate transport system substrate-binding protein|nr:TRAP transporter substrate-binding protein [Thermincola sp.]MDT3702996.1 TRAP transporter substrate-binding protein [Thermincola sp.]